MPSEPGSSQILSVTGIHGKTHTNPCSFETQMPVRRKRKRMPMVAESMG